MTPINKFCFVFLLAAVLLACNQYSVTLNQQPVYTPPPLYADYQLTDRALHNCVKQTIADRKVYRADQLKNLNCASAGITDLEGIGTFQGLEAINLADNKLQTLAPLLLLPNLKVLKISGNAQIDCQTLAQLKSQQMQITAPGHCLDF